MRRNATLEVAGRSLKLSNPSKVLYPATGFSKGQVVDYYTRIGPVLLPHLKDGQVFLDEGMSGAPP